LREIVTPTLDAPEPRAYLLTAREAMVRVTTLVFDRAGQPWMEQFA